MRLRGDFKFGGEANPLSQTRQNHDFVQGAPGFAQHVDASDRWFERIKTVFRSAPPERQDPKGQYETIDARICWINRTHHQLVMQIESMHVIGWHRLIILLEQKLDRANSG